MTRRLLSCPVLLPLLAALLLSVHPARAASSDITTAERLLWRAQTFRHTGHFTGFAAPRVSDQTKKRP